MRDAVTAFTHPQLVAQAIEANVSVEEQLRATVLTLTRAFEAGVDYDRIRSNG